MNYQISSFPMMQRIERIRRWWERKTLVAHLYRHPTLKAPHIRVQTRPMETDVNILKAIPLFHDLPEEDLQQFLELLTRRSFEPGDEIVQPDHVQDDVSAGYLVLSGQVQLSLRDEDGRY